MDVEAGFCNPLLKKRINNWSEKYLSGGAKEVLVKSVL
jgi:hypothetical protein